MGKPARRETLKRVSAENGVKMYILLIMWGLSGKLFPPTYITQVPGFQTLKACEEAGEKIPAETTCIYVDLKRNE